MPTIPLDNSGITPTRILLAIAAIFVAGCGRPATEITGTVTLDGVALPDATLDFFPTSGVGRVSLTKTDARGQYRTAVSAGTLSVVVLATKVVGQIPDRSEGGMTDDIRSVVPDRYRSHATTPLTADPVEDKTTTIDFSLESSGK